jgi:N-acetylneuraminic acid mutarotase
LSSPLFWTGRELLILGATWELATAGGGLQGVAYDPGANRWRRLAPSPQSPQLADRHLLDRTTVWTGSRLLVFNYWSRSARDPGIVSQTGMTVEPDGCEVWAYDPAADTWTPVPGLAGGAAWPEAAGAWTGSELLVWSTTITSDLRSVANTASAYNPGSGRWRRLPPAPIAPRQLAGLVWAGDRLLVWGGLRNLRGNRLAYPDDGAAYDPRGNRWQRLARAPVPGRASPLTVWTGDRAIFVGGMNIGDRVRMDRGNIPAITEQGAAYRPR